jgi:hypothetical protein
MSKFSFNPSLAGCSHGPNCIRQDGQDMSKSEKGKTIREIEKWAEISQKLKDGTSIEKWAESSQKTERWHNHHKT